MNGEYLADLKEYKESVIVRVKHMVQHTVASTVSVLRYGMNMLPHDVNIPLLMDSTACFIREQRVAVYGDVDSLSKLVESGYCLVRSENNETQTLTYGCINMCIHAATHGWGHLMEALVDHGVKIPIVIAMLAIRSCYDKYRGRDGNPVPFITEEDEKSFINHLKCVCVTLENNVIGDLSKLVATFAQPTVDSFVSVAITNIVDQGVLAPIFRWIINHDADNKIFGTKLMQQYRYHFVQRM